MLSTLPFKLDAINAEDRDKEIPRAAIIAELDTLNLYEQMASLTASAAIKAILLDVARVD